MATRRKKVEPIAPVEQEFPDWTPETFADYLDGTFIPDLVASGNTATAEDFERVSDALKSGGTSDQQFIAYLAQLQKDNEESGNEATAEDYGTAIKLLSAKTTASPAPKPNNQGPGSIRSRKKTGAEIAREALEKAKSAK